MSAFTLPEYFPGFLFIRYDCFNLIPSSLDFGEAPMCITDSGILNGIEL